MTDSVIVQDNWSQAIVEQDAKKGKKVFHHCRLRHLANFDSADILNHFKSDKTYKKDMDTQKKVIVQDIYEKDIISRVLTQRNLTKKIKLPNGEQKHVPVGVMEVALFDAYKLFVTENPGIKVSQRNFEIQTPKEIRLKKDGKRLVCACTYHVNIDHLQKALSNLLSVNNKPMKEFKTMLPSQLQVPSKERLGISCTANQVLNL